MKFPERFTAGYALEKLPLEPHVQEAVRHERWKEVEDTFWQSTAPGGAIEQHIRKFHDFSSIEIMISIRDGSNEWEEDGIWHDDGSRVFAFSLSLTENPETIEGGNLELRRKDSEASVLIPTPDFGTAILFLTGVHGYEHRTRQVIKGKRIILVGWCLA